MTNRCTCSPCSMCHGRGSFSVDMRGCVVPYFDDLCDIEMCDECGGSGYARECEHCSDQREQDDAEEAASEPSR